MKETECEKCHKLFDYFDRFEIMEGATRVVRHKICPACYRQIERMIL